MVMTLLLNYFKLNGPFGNIIKNGADLKDQPRRQTNIKLGHSAEWPINGY